HLAHLELGGEALQVLLEGGGDVGGVDGEFSHGAGSLFLGSPGGRRPLVGAGAGVVARRRVAQKTSRSCWRRWRTEPSMTVSPTWATTPPMTDGSTMTLTSTSLPVALASAAASRVRWSSVRSMAERTSATSLSPAWALMATNASMMRPRSRARPVPTTIDTRAVVVSVALPDSTSATISLRPSAGRWGSD